MKISTLTLTPVIFTQEVNKIKEIFLEKMMEQKIISEEQMKEMNQYCLVIAEKSFFGKIWDKIFWKENPEVINIIVVKILN